ncbi:hypothetical protein HYY71_02550 [Candidatus Woesearchaeota archaeon]|nr:hypothetical protein [Candidatus Woesearchaeota archaeon]
MTFAEFFSKDGRNVIELLEAEAQKDINLLKQIHDLYKEKLVKVKEIVDAWENGRNIESFDSFIKEIKKINKTLMGLIDKMLELETKEESIVKVLLARNSAETSVPVQHSIEELIEKLKDNLDRFRDILISLGFVIAKQNFFIKNAWSGKIVLDYEQHGQFFLMLKDEMSIEERLDKFAVEVEHEAKYLLGITTSKPQGAISFEEALSPDSPDFNRLYDEIFKEIFPDSGELLPLKELKDNLRWRYERIRKNGEIYHILIAKIGPVPVGASMFSTKRVNNIVCLGCLWYFFLAKKMAESDLTRKGVLAKQLLEATLQLFRRDMQRFGYKELSIIVSDLPPNPERKTEFHKGSESFKEVIAGMNRREINSYLASYKHSYELQLRLKRIVGFRKADFTYVVPDLDEEKSKYPKYDVKYCDFYVCPLREKWRQAKRMHSSEILPILKFYVDLGFDLLNKRPELYKAMEREIVRKEFVKLI